MSDTLLANEPILKGVRDSLLEQLDHAGKALARHPLADEDVHTIRKELKRVRASLRLLRDALGIAEYRRLNRAIRDAARPLATMRDAKVLLQALEKIVEKAGESSRLPISDELRHALRQELFLNRAQLKAADVAAIRRRLNAIKRGLQGLSSNRLDQAGIDAAIKRAHKKARNAFRAVKREPSDDSLHEWRKQVKYEFNQLALLQPLKPKRIGAIVEQARKLCDHLGDDHDLAILHERMVAQSQQLNTAEAVANADAMLKALKSLRTKLQRKAHRLGKLLYGAGSKVTRMAGIIP
jgi:CHAD domain-containing protein